MGIANVLKTYDFKQVRMIIGTQLIGGSGDEGGIAFSAEEDDWEHTVGADGEVVASATNDERIVATITVKATNKAVSKLYALYRSQKIIRPIIPLGFMLTDPILGDIVPATYCLFLNFPDVDKMKATAEYEFRVLLPYAKKDIQLGVLNLI